MNLSEFKKGLIQPSPVYLVITDQAHLKKEVLKLVQEQVEEPARSFDYAVFDLEEDSEAAVVNVARTLPWLSPHRWVYVKQAERASKELFDYLNGPSSRTVLVLEAGRRLKQWSGIPTVDAEDTSAQPWVRMRASEEGYSIEPRAAAMLVEMVGDDFQHLEQELEKQFLLVLDTRKITVSSVLEVTQEAREHEVFELIRSIAVKDRANALRLVQILADAGISPQQMLSLLYWNFRRLLVAWELLEQNRPFQTILKELKIWSYRGREGEIRSYDRSFLARVLLQIREADRLLKTTTTDPRTHLTRFILGLFAEEA